METRGILKTIIASLHFSWNKKKYCELSSCRIDLYFASGHVVCVFVGVCLCVLMCVSVCVCV